MSNKEKMIEKYGSLEAYRVHLALVGSLGGKKKVKKGFGTSHELAVIAGRAGGRVSRRRKK